ncbi:MAG: MOSC domain-containing protein [Polaromonas sp.]|uniref:MOSC domain-containing protein n=1 Tax=Polaromonas sp. TaxID=1869339 RepID=UPI00185903A6|nr:MOSC domain-containing protein [Polaromonas sp.]MBA3594205.1 MOSC domain-containing protein [Polaromonas sp.]
MELADSRASAVKLAAAHRLLSVQVGAARRVPLGGRSVLTGMVKRPVNDAVPVLPLGLRGDEQADLSIHGGLEKAVYAYPAEHYAFWQAARREQGLGLIDDSLPHGSLGENLTLLGLLENQVWAGDVLRFPDCELQVRIPREPCYKFNAAMGFARASKMMAQSGLCGFYLSVLTPGSISAGQEFELLPGRRSIGIPQLFAAKMTKHLR